jgi:capsular polysaccharide biosynthesis protein
VSKHGRHAWKVRESQVERVLPAREPGTRLAVLETLPAGRVCAENIHCDYGPGPAERWPRPLEHPELVVRHYEGDLVSLGGTRLLAGGTVLPESFRYPYAPLQIHPHMRTVTPNVVALGRRAPAPVLESDVYFLDCLFSGHFGHLTTEVVSRLWGWDAARRQVPGLRALFHTNPARGRDGSLERRLFTSFGIQESDLVWSDRPVRLRSVVGASPMWHNHRRYYAHPGLRDTWARITHGLLAGAEPSSHERIFVSRGDSFSHRRGCLNRDEVEALFADRGFHVFYPEEHSLEEQAALFAGARVVAGFGGSAMGNLMHSRRLEALVILSHNAYTGRNEHLFASLLGAELHYFWQQADVAPPRVGRSRESDRSSFTVDLAGQGEDLRRVLSGV